MKDEKNVFTRRDFIRNSAGAVAVAGLAGRLNAQAAKPGAKSKVVLVRDQAVLEADGKVNVEALKKMLNETVTRVTGKKNAGEAWKSLVKPEDTVGIVPTKAVIPVHQELYDAVQAALLEAGVPQAKIANVQQRNLELVKPCTALINMPVLKAHWLTGIGTVLKNYVLFSGAPRDYHDANSAKLGAIWNMDIVKGKTRLVLVDALVACYDKGPQPDPQYKWEYKGLIAGFDPVAVDAVCLKIIMEKRNLMKGEPWPLSPPPGCVEAADKEYGLGTSNLDAITIEKVGWKEGILV